MLLTRSPFYKRRLQWAAYHVLALYLCPSVSAQKNYGVEYLGLAEGFPSLNVKAITQDRQGLMWFACYDDGLIRYDGARTKVLNHTIGSVPRLGGGRIRDLLIDPKGMLWIAHESGIDILNPQTLQLVRQIALNAKDPGRKAEVRSLCLDRSGNIWASAYALGIFRFPDADPGRMELVHALNSADYINLCVDGKLRAIGHPDLILEWNQDHFTPQSYPRACTPEQVETVRVIENEDGYLCGFRLMLKDDRSECFQIQPQSGIFIAGLPADGITALTHPEMAQRIRLSSSRLSRAPLYNHAIKTFKDANGLIWVAPGYGGAFKLRPSLIHFSSCPDLYDLSLRGMLEGPDDKVFITSYDGIFKYDISTNRALKISHKGKQIFYNIGSCENGNLTVFSEYQGFGRYNIAQDAFIPAPRTELNPDDAYYSSLSLDNGWLLAGNLNIFRVHTPDFRMQKFATLPSRPGLYTYCYHPTRSGLIWLGTTQGVFILYPDGRTEAPAIRKDPRLSDGSQVNDIYEDLAGNLWFATRDYGLLHYFPSNDSLEAFDLHSGFSSNTTYKIAGSHHDSILWVSTFAGLQCIQVNTRKIHLFREEDGTSGAEFNTGSFLKLHNGDILFGGVKGLTRFNPRDFNPYDSIPPTPYITDLVVEDPYTGVLNIINYPSRDTLLQFAASQSSITFNFGSFQYFQANSNTYYVQLEGVDPSWTPLNTETSIKYHRLPPGYYTFKVKLGVKGFNGAEIEYRVRLRIEEVFYKKWWFLLILILAGSLLLYLVYRSRQLRRIREENIRRRIAFELHSALGGKISTISNLIHLIARYTAEQKPINKELQHLADTVRRAHSTFSDVIWVLTQKTESVDGLVNRMHDYIDKWIKTGNIEVEFEQNIEQLEKPIPFSTQHILLLIFKEMLGNILKHTFSQLVAIRFIQNEDNSIDLSVKNTFNERKTDVPSSNQGLQFIRQQVERLGGTVNIRPEENSFEITVHLNHPFSTRFKA